MTAAMAAEPEPHTGPESHPHRMRDEDPPVVLVVMGVSGSGKTTVAELLAHRLGWEHAEGDDMHPAANVAKMHAGIPLDDDDRAPWLEVVASWIREHTTTGTPGIVTCSALKRRYRDVLRGPGVVFVHLAGAAELIGTRMAARTGHYMPTSLLDSQLATLEPPQADERHLRVDADRSPEAEADEVIERLGLGLGLGLGPSDETARP